MPSTQTGVRFTNQVSDVQIATNRLLEDGSGVALGDFDGDGWLDIYLCRLGGPNALYRNLGNWKFEEVTAKSGVTCAGQFSTGAVFADVDGDGDLDLLVNSLGGGTRLFLNQGDGEFTESQTSGLNTQYGAHSMALADVDGDGDLDLYVTNYRATTAKDAPTRVKLKQVAGKWEVPPEFREQFRADISGSGAVALLEMGEPDVLYLNEGRGHFIAQSWTDGRFLNEDGQPLSEIPRDWGLSAMFRDLNRDGLPDLYVCNDYFTPDRIWINQGKGVFRALPRLALRQTSWAAMSVDVADLNRDGWDEIFVSEMLSRDHVRRNTQHSLREVDSLPAWGWGEGNGDIDRRLQVMRNTLALSRGDGTYAEIANFSGVQASEWTWGCLFLDVDLDGFEDLLIANGHSRDLANSDSLATLNRLPPATTPESRIKSLHLFPPLPLPHLAFRNRGDLTFEEVGHAWGFDLVSAANGMAEGDLDNDGDLDLVLNNLNGEASLLRNTGTAPRVAVRLHGQPPNPQGIGARITLSGGPVKQSQEMISGGRYLSGGEALRVFASGRGTNLTLEVTWRSGRHGVLRGVQANRIYEMDEAGAETSPAVPVPNVSPFFVEVSERLGHIHHEEPFDDFARQPLLPRRLSRQGPGVAWADLNGDGAEDLIVGTGRGGALQVFAGNAKGAFAPVASPVWNRLADDDLTGMVTFSREVGANTLLVGQANYESGRTNTPAVLSYEVFFGGVQAGPNIPGDNSSVGPLAVADLDGDGDLDLFVGGRVIPGRYPAAASSRIFRQEAGQWILDDANSQALREVGLVSGAVWTDLDGDGLPELVLACEWGPVRVFANRTGHLEEATDAWGLSTQLGWWTGVTAGDLDGDGRLDLIVGNWGRNTVYEEAIGEEWRVHHGDLDGNGTWDIIEGRWNPVSQREVPRRDWRTMGQAIPAVAGRFNRYQDYGSATVQEILGPELSRLPTLRINTLEAVLLMNRGKHFERRSLPWEAQLAPSFGVSVGDYDGDGHEDIFLSQNFFGLDRESGRLDAGRGLWLQGDGAGGLRAVSGSESGIKIYGEGRGTALGDFDHDGRVDLVVGQNGAATRLFHNVRARPGLRVQLVGPPGNASGLGAVLRLGTASQPGPARELHGGSGWWSQDSPVSVLAKPSDVPLILTVTWPSGRKTTSPVPAQAQEVRQSIEGKLEVLR